LKQLISIPLLCCFFLNVIGYHIVFYFQREEIKDEMKTLVRRGDNHNEKAFVFYLSDKEILQKLYWEGNDEFSFNGQMYDVVEKKIEDGKIMIRCIADKKETALVNKLNDNCTENDKGNKIVNELFQFLQTLFHNSKSEDRVRDELVKCKFHFPIERLLFQIKKIPTPPPQAGISHFNPVAIGSL